MNEYNLSTLVEKSQAVPVKAKEKSIEEEIKFLTQLSLMVQEKNEKYKKIIEEESNPDKTDKDKEKDAKSHHKTKKK